MTHQRTNVPRCRFSHPCRPFVRLGLAAELQGRRGALMVLFGLVASSALATGASPMEGTWGGADAQGRTAQITIIGNRVIGVFWGQDYHDAENGRFSKNGAQLDFTIDGAKASCVRDSARGHITVPRDRRPRDLNRLEERLAGTVGWAASRPRSNRTVRPTCRQTRFLPPPIAEDRPGSLGRHFR